MRQMANQNRVSLVELLPRNSLTRARLEAYSMPEPNSGCQLWLGSDTGDGYGRLMIGKTRYLAHRLAYEEYIGPIPAGLFVLHHCDTPPCINPTHLFLGTNSDNMDDMVAKNRQWRPIGERNSRAQLSAANVSEIAEALKTTTLPQRIIAGQYGISRAEVAMINTGRNWAHITQASPKTPIRKSRHE